MYAVSNSSFPFVDNVRNSSPTFLLYYWLCTIRKTLPTFLLLHCLKIIYHFYSLYTAFTSNFGYFSLTSKTISVLLPSSLWSKNIFASHPTNIFLFTNASQFHTLLSFTPIKNNFPMHTTQRRCNIRRQRSLDITLYVLQLWSAPSPICVTYFRTTQYFVRMGGRVSLRFRDFLAEFFT